MPCFFQRLVGKQVHPEQFRGEVIDIGYNGLLMSSPIPLDPYAEIMIAVSLQLLGAETTDIYARVIKVEKSGVGVLCSLEFTSMDMAGQQTIKRFVDNLVFPS
jgi:adenylate cyclase